MLHLFTLASFVLLLFLLQTASAAFVQTSSCNVDDNMFVLELFVIDAAIDEKNKMLKFFMNSKVINYWWSEYFSEDDESEVEDMYEVPNIDSSQPMITDVNTTSNTFTTFHVEIDFMGKTFKTEDLRFCDLVAVKTDTQQYYNGPRYFTILKPSANPKLPGGGDRHNVTQSKNVKREEAPGFNDSLANSNASIEYLFSNSTGELVQCPLYVNDSIVLYYEADISQHFHRLGSYSVKFSVISTNQRADVLGCNQVYVTPIQPEWVSNAIMVGVIVLLVVTAFVNLFTVAFSSYQESSNPFLFTASTICNEKLLKQLDATVPGIIMYLQFALFMAALDLDYPGFFQPLIGQLRWCALLGYPIINRDSGANAVLDNIYRTINTGGLKSLIVYFNTDTSAQSNWPNFILCLLIWILCLVILQLTLFVVKYLFDRYMNFRKGNHTGAAVQITFRKNIYLIGGQILNNFFVLFALPFLVLTSYMFATASSLNGKHKFFPNLSSLNAGAFNTSMDYDALFAPAAYILSKYSSDQKKNGTVIHHPSNYTMESNSTSSKAYLVELYTTIPVGSIVSGTLLFTAWIGLALFFTFNYLITFRNWRPVLNPRVSRLYTSMKAILLWAFLYHQFHPSRVMYTAYYLFILFAKLIFIGCCQDRGVVQVIALIIFEFCDLVALITLKPYFVKISLSSSVWMLAMAKFVVTFLCVSFVKELNISEKRRTYAAYAQLIIHLIVALVFIVQLVYCFVGTIATIVKIRREKTQYAKYSQKTNSLGEFAQYNNIGDLGDIHNANNQPLFIKEENELEEERKVDDQFDNNGNTVLMDSVEVDPSFYYRSKSVKALKNDAGETIEMPQIVLQREYTRLLISFKGSMINLAEIPGEVTDELNGLFDSLSELQSFTEEQKYSNIRKQQNDYRVREGDMIYKKYFLDDSIDAEVKELWDSRQYWDIGSASINIHKESDHEAVSLFTRVKSALTHTREEPPKKGFQVARPRKLVVKTLNQIEEEKQKREGEAKQDSDMRDRNANSTSSSEVDTVFSDLNEKW